jgi:hypothetical protein
MTVTDYRPYDHFKTITTLTTILIAIGVAFIGGFLLYLSHKLTFFTTHSAMQGLCRDLGSLCVVVVALSLLWELLGKRALGREMLAKAGLSRELTNAGIVHVAVSHDKVEWNQLFYRARYLDVFFTYGRSWRAYYERQIRELLGRPDSRLRVVLPDPEDKGLMKALGNRFRKSPGDQAKDIRESRDFFVRVATEAAAETSVLEVWYTSSEPVVSLYRFDDLAVISFYPHKEKTDVPHIVCRKTGSLFEYVEKELRVLTDESEGVSRCVHPVHQED